MKTILRLLLLICILSAPASAQRSPDHVPDAKLTPGDASDVSKDTLCSAEYSNPANKLSVSLKRQVFDRYAMSPQAVGYNVDHLIPVSLGGSNSLTNLWPQPLSGEWSYQMKNKLEQKLYKMVCSGAITLEQARKEIAADWVSAYRKYLVRSRRPAFGRNASTPTVLPISIPSSDINTEGLRIPQTDWF